MALVGRKKIAFARRKKQTPDLIFFNFKDCPWTRHDAPERGHLTTYSEYKLDKYDDIPRVLFKFVRRLKGRTNLTDGKCQRQKDTHAC